jgi:hypothetical protein
MKCVPFFLIIPGHLMPHKNIDVRRAYARQLAQRRRAASREDRWEDRRQRIAARSVPSEHDLHWAAGLFEGEGTVTLSRSGNYVRPCVCLTSTDDAVIAFFNERWRGVVTVVHPKSKNGIAKPAWRWALQDMEPVECFLRDIIPMLRTARVRQKAELVLADIFDRSKYERDTEAQNRSRERMAKVRDLNRRGAMPKMLPDYSGRQ